MRRLVRNCCFCLPLQSALTAISGISVVVYGGVFVWLLVKRDVISGYFQTELNIAKPFLYLYVAVSALFFFCALLGLLSSMQQNQQLLRIFCVCYWVMTAVVLIVTFAAWIALLVLRDETVASCNQYHSQLRATGVDYYDIPGGGLLDADEGNCGASVRNLTIFGAFVVFVGNALQLYFAVIITASALGRDRNINYRSQPPVPLQYQPAPYDYRHGQRDPYYQPQASYQSPPPPYAAEETNKPVKY